MTLIIRIVVFIVMLFITNIYAQDFQGIATYKSKRKIDIKLDSTQFNSEMQEQLKAMMSKQFEKTFKLHFNKEASIYKQEESLGAPNVENSNVRVVMVDTGGADELYRNTKENRYVNQNDVFGKLFLIKDSLNKIDWKLGSETKNIGDYTCYKATFKRKRQVISQTSIRRGETKNEQKTEAEEVLITAWYTPQIPVNTGPGNYFGLPGLILEVNDGSEVVICSKIVLNPEKRITIIEPKKGKIVNQDKFNEIMQKKMKEMQERQGGRRDGEQMSIRIRG